VFFLVALAMVFVILRRLGCNTCDYCKTCTMGLGRLSGWFFGIRNVKDTRNKTAVFFVTLVYGLLGRVPIALLTTSTVQDSAVMKTVLLSCITGFFVYSLATWLRKAQATKN